MTAPSSGESNQIHPLWHKDRLTLNQILQGEPTPLNLVELARLRIRYNGFPGARDIQADLEKAMQRWKLTEDQLFEQTRAIHVDGQVYRGEGEDKEDWS